MDYATYKQNFSISLKNLGLPANCKSNPQFVFAPPRNWHFIWVIEFDDGFYVRVRELWSAKRGASARRIDFTFHYGKIVHRDQTGEIEYQHTDPVVVRFDQKNGEAPHLHYRNPTPHFTQDRVKGFTITDAEMFTFLRAILEFRLKGVEPHLTLGFTVS